MRILTFFYTIWATFWFVFLFVLLFPLFWLFLQKPAWKPKAHYLNRFWGKMFFPIAGIPIKVQYDFEPDLKKTYVFCANHFSYVDIASMGMIIKNYYAFVGKSSIKGVPLFGYMFAKLHIQVDREDKNSRVTSMTRSLKALQSGRSIMIFPEGGIWSKDIPKMALPLKDGAFAMAIKQQIPIVPITLLNNYKIMRDGEFAVHPQTLRAIVHQPIETTGMTNDDIEDLKMKFYEVVQGALDNYKAKITVQ
jgi:1-acyl-sn-glycerol-3-phosphate acyltransferase